MDDFPRRPDPDESRASGDANLALAPYESADAAAYGIEPPPVTEPAYDEPGAPVVASNGMPFADSAVVGEGVTGVAADALPASDTLATPSFPRPSHPVRVSAWRRIVAELTAGVQTLFSAAVYATLIVTFGFQVARVDGLSMAPTLEDHDRLIVNKLVYELGDPRPGDIVMLYYPLNPEKMFVKRVIAREGDIGPHRRRPRLRQRHPAARRLRARRVPQPRRLGPEGDSAGLLLRDGRSPQQQLGQPPLGPGAEEVHRRQGEGALVAAAGRYASSSNRSRPLT